ncbi:MAG: hypothetical protein V2B18_07060, partial [Pseudomonadota bacterium]
MNELMTLLSKHFGIEAEYTDNWGKLRPTDTETARRVLGAMGLAVDPKLAHSKPDVVVVSGVDGIVRISVPHSRNTGDGDS